MRVLVLSWDWTNGYDSANDVIGVYTSYNACEEAYEAWLSIENGNPDEYNMDVKEMELK